VRSASCRPQRAALRVAVKSALSKAILSMAALGWRTLYMLDSIVVVGRRMMLKRRHRQPVLSMALLASLWASVGMHVVHPAFHEHGRAAAPLNHGVPPAGIHLCARWEEGPGAACRLWGDAPCPICAFLAAFHAACDEPAGPLLCTDEAPEHFRSFGRPAVQSAFWSPTGARGPPTLPVV